MSSFALSDFVLYYLLLGFGRLNAAGDTWEAFRACHVHVIKIYINDKIN